MGGIYTLGKQPGTVISGNVIHNVAADSGEGGYGGWGIYLDEGSSYMLVQNNLVFCCGSQGLNIHYGNDNIFNNNISALNAQGAASIGAKDEFTAVYTHNIFLTSDSAPIYIYMKNTEHFRDNGNLMWDLTKGSKLLFCESNSGEPALNLCFAKRLNFLSTPVVADPLFTDALSFDFTLDETSPAVEMGFTPWNYGDAGTLKGSVIGISHTGGETAYADGAQLPEFVPCREKNLRDHLRDLYAYIVNTISAWFSGLDLMFRVKLS